MAKDMHIIRSLLEDAKALYAKGDCNAARAKIAEMHRVYQDADIDGISGLISKGFIGEGEEILFDMQAEQLAKSKQKFRSLWARLFD